MCGIVGLYSSSVNGFNNPETEFMLQSLFINQLRGNDSTGIVAISSAAEALYLKELGGYKALVSSEHWEVIRKHLFSKGRAFFAHGRSATRGTVSLDNAHPFVVEKKNGSKIILIHNGTLGYSQDLPGFFDHNVDSNWLAECVAKYGPEETFSKVNGPIATIWWDDEDGSMNIFRNKERPLHFAISKQGDMYIHSEQAGLAFMKLRLGLNFDIDKDIFQFPTDSHIHIPVKQFDRIKNWEAVKQTAIKKVTRSYSSSRKGWADLYGDLYSEYEAEEEEDPVSKRRIERDYLKDTAVRSYEKDIKAIWNGIIEKTEWRDGWCFTSFNAGGTRFLRQTATPGPYNHALVSMELSLKKDKIELTYSDGRVGTISKSKEKARERDINNPLRDFLIIPTKPGKTIKWHSKANGGATVKHKALCEKASPSYFSEYCNDVDGAYVIGQDVRVEIFSIIDNGFGFVEIRGSLVNTEASGEINVIAFGRADIKELDDASFIQGGISGIRIASPATYKDTGACIEITLKSFEIIVTPKVGKAVIPFVKVDEEHHAK